MKGRVVERMMGVRGEYQGKGHEFTGRNIARGVNDISQDHDGSARSVLSCRYFGCPAIIECFCGRP